MNLTIKEIKKLFPHNTLELADDLEVVGINRDSRAIQKGEIYVALQGENFDGHEFIDQAFEKGAVAALVDKKTTERPNLILSDDVIKGLGELATYYRSKFDQPVIAITGSNGKTTTKEFLAHVLRQTGKVVATEGNLNNHIGVPITLFSFTDDAQYFIVELGMNHFEEVRYLTKMTQPDMALITSIGLSHLEGVGGTIEGVAKAKGELFEELTPNGTAFVYLDDSHISQIPTRAKRVTFGFTEKSEIWASDLKVAEQSTTFFIHHGDKKIPAQIRMVGKQHVQNAVSVYAIATQLGFEDEIILNGLQSFELKINRGQILKKGNLIIIDDTYNANPDSMRATLQTLREAYPSSYKIAVLGGMLELGERASPLHYEVGKFFRQAGIDEIFAYGENAIQYLKGFGYGEDEIEKRCFQDHKELAEALLNLSAQKEIVILLKGSRGMTMEKVLNYL